MKYSKNIKLLAFLFHKSKASTVVSDMVPVLMTVILTGMLALCYASWIGNFEVKEHINAIAREYVLRMGTVGYLTLEDKTLLLEELEAQKLENISLQGTTVSKVENGEIVTLKISGDYNYSKVKMFSLFSWKADGTEKDKTKIEIERCTTAMY